MQTPNRNLFRITRFILLRFPGLFRFLARFRAPQQNLLLLKTDAIGDYILFRNYLEVLRKSARYKDYRITLLGNELWQDIALEHDREYVDDFIFIRPGDLDHLPLKTFKLGWRLFKNNYDVVLQPSYTRLLITDGLAALTAARHIVGFMGDIEGLPERYKTKTDQFYTIKLVLPAGKSFEFDRSQYFFSNVLDYPVNLKRPYLTVSKKIEKTLIIFPGAGVSKRRWEAEKFLVLIKLILEQSNVRILIAGSADETEIGNYLMERLPIGRVNNLAGKTPLTQLIELIGNAALVISNETSAVHIAAAVKTPAICILGGGHFGRFAPYPVAVEDAPVCMFEQMECYNCNWNCIYQIKDGDPFPCITAVTLEKVWADVQHYL